jgi:hypothetical protein
MTGPKRWSESGSDTDPVLRSVMRYAKTQEPTPEQVRELLRATRAATGQAPSVFSLRMRRRGKSVLFALAAIVAGGASWAAYRVYGDEPKPSSVVAPTVQVPAPKPSAEVVHRRAAVTQPEPQATPSAVFAPEEAPKASSKVPPRRVQEPEDELAVLEEARRLVPNNPAAALALTRDHAVRHPAGTFAEEREALAIEALRRLNRIEEASARLRAFEERYPRSPYRRRLGAAQ